MTPANTKPMQRAAFVAWAFCVGSPGIHMSSPQKNVAYGFYVQLTDSATGDFKVNPTIAVGDFKHSGGSGTAADGTVFIDLATLPVVDPSGSRSVLILLSQGEMNYNKIQVQCIDAAGDEWNDVTFEIEGTIANSDTLVRSTSPANALDVNLNGQAGLDLDNTSGTIDASQIALDAIGSSQLATTAINEIRDAILSDSIPFAGANIDAAVSTRATPTQVNTEVDTALADIDLDHLVKNAVGIPAITAGTFFDQMLDDGTTSFDRTTHSLQALRDRGDAAWVTATGFSTLDAAGVRTAVGLAAANLDVQMADIPTVAEFNARTLIAADYFDPAADIVANVTTVGTLTGHTPQTADHTANIAAILADTGTDGVALSAAAVDDIWDEALEGSYTGRQLMRVISSACAGKASGLETTSAIYRDINDSVDRITATVDDDGNRTAVTLNVA